MRAGDLWQAAFIAVAAYGGFLIAGQSLSWAYVLAFPVAFLFIAFSSRRAAWVNQSDDGRGQSPAHQERLAETERALVDAEQRASRASMGLVRAAELAVRTEEDVRALIVADLHDAPAQTLVAVNFLRLDPDVTVARIAQLAADAESQLRDVMQSQRPLPEQASSLAEVLANHLAELEERWGLQVDVVWPTVAVALPYAVTVVLFRFAAESLMNVIKHAGTLKASLELHVSGGQVHLTVRDQGAGFDTELLEVTDRLGLSLIRHRAEMVAGRVEVTSAPGEGTASTVHIPLLETP